MTHEKEIVYWSKRPDNTKVWCKTTNGRWILQNEVHWSKGLTYIVEDRWAELRKAVADGKTIQIYNEMADVWENMPKRWWKTNFYEDYKMFSPVGFRIKPENEEPNWYDNIPDDGIICWVWDNYEDRKCLRLVVGFRQGAKYPFEGAVNGFIKETISNWKHAEPVKCSELYKRGR